MTTLSNGKPRVRSFHTSPIATAIALRNGMVFLLLPGVAFFQVAVKASPWWLGVVIFAIAVAQLIVVLGGGAHGRFLRGVRQLHARLPWFRADAVTWLDPEQLAALRTELANTKIEVHEIDGAAMRTADDLAAAMQQHFGKRTFPDEPIAKTVAILGKLGEDRKRAHALVWLAANELAATDAEAFTRFVTTWTGLMHTSTPHVLVFLVGSRAAVVATAAPPEPAVQGDAWWKRRPGEFVAR